MKANTLTLLYALCAGLVFQGAARADELADAYSKVKVQPVIPLRARAFPLQEVRLLDGPFKHAMELDEQYLLSLEPNRLLHNFRVTAGLPSSAQPYGGWEAPNCELRGHFVGHYLSACAQMYASTGDARFKEKGDAVVAGMAECQAKMGSGYLSAYPEEEIDRVEKQQNVWAPYYTLHKIFAGLLDMYEYGDNTNALRVAEKFGDWVIARNGKLTDAQMQGMMGNEHGGMNEALANLYALTGEEKYKAISLRFDHLAVMTPMSEHKDILTGLHANTQIPKFIGAARQYELTGGAFVKNAASFFWETVVNERSYVIGGHSDGEGFSPKEHLSEAFGPNTTETCNTYNMLKLTRHLFCWDPQARYADYYERALYNHILSSQNPETGMMCYYVPLREGSHKNFNSPENDFWCCTGTGVENHSKYGDSIYFHDEQSLYVNLFIASELDWKARGVKVRQETKYPDADTTHLKITSDKSTALTMRIRHPYWCKSGFEIKVNGQRQASQSEPGAYAIVDRTWRSGDTVDITMPFSLRTEGFADNPNRFAFMDGPLVLCAPVKEGGPFPVVLGDEGSVLAGVKPEAGKPNTFESAAGIFALPGHRSDTRETLAPFYKKYDGPYKVYWDRFTTADWSKEEVKYAAEQKRFKELEANSVDWVAPGEEQNERDHNEKGDKTSTGDFREKKFRHAEAGGWYSWDLKVEPGQAELLAVSYWGEDTARVFDLWVDGRKLATQSLDNNHPGVFYDEYYNIPPDMTIGKTKITLKFKGVDGLVGGVFGVRVLKPGAVH